MPNHRSEYLIDKLLKNELSEEELKELIAGLDKEEYRQHYSAILEKYFDWLIEQEKPNDYLSHYRRNTFHLKLHPGCYYNWKRHVAAIG